MTANDTAAERTCCWDGALGTREGAPTATRTDSISRRCRPTTRLRLSLSTRSLSFSACTVERSDNAVSSFAFRRADSAPAASMSRCSASFSRCAVSSSRLTSASVSCRLARSRAAVASSARCPDSAASSLRRTASVSACAALTLLLTLASSSPCSLRRRLTSFAWSVFRRSTSVFRRFDSPAPEALSASSLSSSSMRSSCARDAAARYCSASRSAARRRSSSTLVCDRIASLSDSALASAFRAVSSVSTVSLSRSLIADCSC